MKMSNIPKTIDPKAMEQHMKDMHTEEQKKQMKPMKKSGGKNEK